METVFAAYPELDGLGVEAEAAPVGRARDLGGMGFYEDAHLLFEGLAVGKRTALSGDGGADLAGARTAVEVGVGLLGREIGDGAVDAHLAAEGLPVKAERGAGIGDEFPALAALVVGEETERVSGDGLGEDHAHAGATVGASGGEGGGVGIVGFLLKGQGEPLVEEGKGIDVQLIEAGWVGSGGGG